MTLLSVSDAAKLAGRNRSTILRAIERGNLSASRDGFGHYAIDPAELERLYGTLRSVDALTDTEHQDAPESSAAALMREVALLREMLDHERRTARDTLEHERQSFEQERTFLRGMLERQTEHMKLLTDERQQKEQQSPTLWARLWRRH